MIAIFLAPVSGGIKNKTVLAQSIDYSNLFPGSYAKFHSASSSSAQFEVQIIGKQSDWEKTAFVSVDVAGLGIIGVNPNSTVLVVMENGNFISSYDLSGEVRNHTTSAGIPIVNRSYIGPEKIGGEKNFFPVSNPPLQPEKNYTVALYIKSISEGAGNGIDLFGSSDKSYYKFGTSDTFSTPPIDGPLTGDNPTEAPNASGSTSVPNFGCDYNPSTWFSNCIAYFLYTVVFQSVAELTKLAAKILDFFVYYSTNDSSYRSEFVTKAWGAVRDVANIFFIIALLYVALKTILGLNVTDNKKLISAVIIVALIINFSLFTTKVVIDASNILAKVFYNNIISKDASAPKVNGEFQDSEAGVEGEKSISVGLVKQFNPQDIIGGTDKIIANLGLFIFITLLSIAMMGFMIYIFLSVALLFVARVVSLWISMIFSPIAFASYTVPFNIPGFGHKEWWDDLLKNAFLAPFFIFFLYVIIMFGDFLSLIGYDTQDPDIIQKAMKTIIPFAVIFILLLKAKHLAVKFSGSIGAAVNKIGAVAGGLALGAATGGTAMLGRATLGRAGAAIASSGALKAAEARGTFGAKQLRSFGKFAGSGSMDLRGIKVGGKGLANAGLTNIGKPKEGGFAKARADKVIDRQKRAKELEVGEDEKSKQNIYKKLDDLDKAKSDPTRQANIATYTKEVADAEKELVKTERELKDAIDKFGGNSAQANSQRLYRDSAVDNVEDKKRQLKIEEQPIKDAEKALKEAQNEVVAENRTRRENYAKTIQGGWSQTINFITSRGQHSFRGEREAANKILAGIQEEKK